MEFVLHHNYFIFKDRYNLQIWGSAIGARCAPSYASLFLGMWEHEDTQADHDKANGKVRTWLRFIDDVLCIWQGTSSELQIFISHLNLNDQNLHLKYSLSRTSLDVLDILIFVDDTGRISMDVFLKKTLVNVLLHASLFHPWHTFWSIPVVQFLRIHPEN